MSRSCKTGLTAAQDVLESLYVDVAQLGLPRLGPEFKKLKGMELAESLISHRILNKFGRPADSDGKRTQDSIQKMLAFDANGTTKVPMYCTFPPGVDVTLWKARGFIHKLLKKVPISNVARFPTGETFTSRHGDVDLLSKLSDLENWEVSRSCLTSAATLCYSNIALRRLAKKHFRVVFGPRAVILQDEWYQESLRKKKSPGFFCFFRMFASICKIVSCSRVTTVPKNLKEDRVISCEPFWNMVVQLSIAADLRQTLLTQIGVDLRFTQQLHRSRIKNPDDATVDLSNASNSNWMCWLEFLWPKNVLDRLKKARTGLFTWDDKDGNTFYQPVNMLAPMGCGFTFEVMTITLLAICRSLDSDASVFGDDIIISRKKVDLLTLTLEYTGWSLNVSKSFTEGNFRESCGSFVDLSNKQYLLSYDILWPENMNDVFVIIQKLENLMAKYGASVLKGVVCKAYMALLEHVPRLSLRPYERRPTSEFCAESVPTRLYKYRCENTRSTSPFMSCLREVYQCEVIPYTAYKLSNKEFSSKGKIARETCEMFTLRSCKTFGSRIFDKASSVTMLVNTGQPSRATGLFAVI